MIKVSSPEQLLPSKNEDYREDEGVPLLSIIGNRSPEDVLHAVCDNDVAKLPTPEEVICPL